MRAGGGGWSPIYRVGNSTRNIIAILRNMCVSVRVNYKAERLISDRNTFLFREQYNTRATILIFYVSVVIKRWRLLSKTLLINI